MNGIVRGGKKSSSRSAHFGRGSAAAGGVVGWCLTAEVFEKNFDDYAAAAVVAGPMVFSVFFFPRSLLL